MARVKLPPEAFDYYVNLGIERTYQAVANYFGVAKRTVTLHAAKENWGDRLTTLRKAVTGESKQSSKNTLDHADIRHMTRISEYQTALHEVLNVQRFKGLIAAAVKSAVQEGDMIAARFLIERILGKPRSEPMPATALDIPDGLETATDVRRAANSILQGIADGSIAPEDGQKTAAVVEAARKSIETYDLERRITTIEDDIKKDRLQ